MLTISFGIILWHFKPFTRMHKSSQGRALIICRPASVGPTFQSVSGD